MCGGEVLSKKAVTPSLNSEQVRSVFHFARPTQQGRRHFNLCSCLHHCSHASPFDNMHIWLKAQKTTMNKYIHLILQPGGAGCAAVCNHEDYFHF